MKKVSFLFALFVCLGFVLPLSADSGSKRVPPKAKSCKLHTNAIRFNGDYIKGYYKILDVRTDDEKARDLAAGKLAGSVILFLHGHSQRPEDGFHLITEMAMQSKSGIVVVPVCNTPAGKNKKWRGDDGKDVILMEMTRYALSELAIEVEGYQPITDMPVTFDKVEINTCLEKAKASGEQRPMIKAQLAVVGWSHGCILARRIASKYPDSVVSMAQMSPAGYEKWNGWAELIPAFGWESTLIGGGTFTGEGKQVMGAGWAIVKGTCTDTFGSVPSCIYGNFSCIKPFNFFRDAGDCAARLTDANFPVKKLTRITVLFGEKDSLFEYRNVGLTGKKFSAESEEKFWSTYYLSNCTAQTGFTLKVLPGNHIGPYVYPRLYTQNALLGIDELREGGRDRGILEVAVSACAAGSANCVQPASRNQ